MSSTNRGGTRVTLDRYYTPQVVADACVATLPNIDGLHVVEPSIGRGAFAVAAVFRGARVTGVDLDEQCDGRRLGLTVHVCDFAAWSPTVPVDWFIGNPPYEYAEAHVRRALSMARRGVAFLLRLAFLESQKRSPLWRQWPPSEVYVLDRRPSFTDDGKSDSAAYAWFVWNTDRPHQGTRLDWLRWSE